MGSVLGRRSSYKGRCVKVLWHKRGANAALCCNLATAAKILDEARGAAVNLGLAIGSVAGTFRCRKTVICRREARMAKLERMPRANERSAKPPLPLPDPRAIGPFRPFTGAWMERNLVLACHSDRGRSSRFSPIALLPTGTALGSRPNRASWKLGSSFQGLRTYAARCSSNLIPAPPNIWERAAWRRGRARPSRFISISSFLRFRLPRNIRAAHSRTRSGSCAGQSEADKSKPVKRKKA
jgi:hypothetical protein